jgi:hypothetical protein
VGYEIVFHFKDTLPAALTNHALAVQKTELWETVCRYFAMVSRSMFFADSKPSPLAKPISQKKNTSTSCLTKTCLKHLKCHLTGKIQHIPVIQFLFCLVESPSSLVQSLMIP